MMIIIGILFLSFIHFSSSDQIITTNIGQDVTFSCHFENEFQFDEVSFMHQTTGDILSFGLELIVDQSILNKHLKLIRFSSNRLDLKIFSVNQNDSGLYTCMLNDDKLSSFLLEIFIPPRFVSYSPYEASVSYPEGSSMNLSCHAFAIPSINITWIYRDKNKQSKTIHNGEDVYISSLQSSDSGSYECIASNNIHASISRSFYVTVQYPPRVMINKLTDIYNKDIQLICEICSMPLSDIQWIKNEKFLLNNQYFIIKIKKIFIENEECIMTTLIIHTNLNQTDLLNQIYGRYECRAQNILGHYSNHIDLHSKSGSIHKSQNEQIASLTLVNNTNSISNSSECIFRLTNIFLLLILFIITNNLI